MGEPGIRWVGGAQGATVQRMYEHLCGHRVAVVQPLLSGRDLLVTLHEVCGEHVAQAVARGCFLIPPVSALTVQTANVMAFLRMYWTLLSRPSLP